MDNWKTDMESYDEGGLVANPNFEVLATFRYDPGFARQSASKKEIFETPDPRLGLRDEDIRQQIINEDYSSYLRVRKLIPAVTFSKIFSILMLGSMIARPLCASV